MQQICIEINIPVGEIAQESGCKAEIGGGEAEGIFINCFAGKHAVNFTGRGVQAGGLSLAVFQGFGIRRKDIVDEETIALRALQPLCVFLAAERS